MRFELLVDMDNVAFAGDYRPELRVVLAHVIVKLEMWSPGSLESDPIPLLDTNGNRCGVFSIKDVAP